MKRLKVAVHSTGLAVVGVVGLSATVATTTLGIAKYIYVVLEFANNPNAKTLEALEKISVLPWQLSLVFALVLALVLIVHYHNLAHALREHCKLQKQHESLQNEFESELRKMADEVRLMEENRRIFFSMFGRISRDAIVASRVSAFFSAKEEVVRELVERAEVLGVLDNDDEPDEGWTIWEAKFKDFEAAYCSLESELKALAELTEEYLPFELTPHSTFKHNRKFGEYGRLTQEAEVKRGNLRAMAAALKTSLHEHSPDLLRGRFFVSFT
ncbi:hypothetical protein [Marinovum sp.]|uniref:hypothetical protein n=1 Tax=Marinovum sp. TaxID=2024839 RepID=UPI002B264D57|nr:hypothetical protein [Marinovum sp.]